MEKSTRGSGGRRPGARIAVPNRRRSLTYEGDVLEVRLIGNSDIRFFRFRTDAGVIVPVAALGLLRRTADELKPGDRIRYRELSDGRRTLEKIGDSS